MDPINLTLKAPAIEKLIDYGASGVGAIAGPLLASWKASREGKARLIAADANARVRQIQAGADASALNIIAEAQSEAQAYLPLESDVHGTLDITREDIAQSMEFQGRKRLVNSRAVLEGAVDELGDKEVDDHDPDPDWTARFFDYVQDVSSEDMQKVWARILAGEVESPGRTSLRTLDTLRNMTKRDAEMFRDICDFVMGGDFIWYDDAAKTTVELQYGKLLHLQNCGLVNVGPFLQKVLRSDEQDYITLLGQNPPLLVTFNGGTHKEIRVPMVSLTEAGRELYQFVEGTLRREYLDMLAKFLQSKDCRLEFLVGVEALSDGMIRYTNRIPIEPQPEESEGATP